MPQLHVRWMTVPTSIPSLGLCLNSQRFRTSKRKILIEVAADEIASARTPCKVPLLDGVT